MKTKFTFLSLIAFYSFSLSAQTVNDSVAKPTDSIALKQVELQNTAKPETLTAEQGRSRKSSQSLGKGKKKTGERAKAI